MRKRVGTFRYIIAVTDRARERFEDLEARVDTGALYSQFPASLLRGLGHTSDTTRRVRLADGGTTEVMLGEAPIRIGDEIRTVPCVFGGEQALVLLGASALEAFALSANPVNETLETIEAMMLAAPPKERL